MGSLLNRNLVLVALCVVSAWPMLAATPPPPPPPPPPVTILPWDGTTPLLDQTRVVFQADVRIKDGCIPSCYSTEPFGPMFVGIERNPSDASTNNYLFARDTTATTANVFTLTVVPARRPALGIPGNYTGGNDPAIFQQVVLRGSNGLYVMTDSGGSMVAKESDINLAQIFILDEDRHRTVLYHCGYQYRYAANLAVARNFTVSGLAFTQLYGRNYWKHQGAFVHPATFVKIFLVQ